MTTSFLIPPPAPRASTVPAKAVLFVATFVAVTALTLAGLTFLGLAIAFPVALPIAEANHIHVSAADAARASQFAGIWWVFAGLALASLSAAAAVIFKVGNHLSSNSAD